MGIKNGIPYNAKVTYQSTGYRYIGQFVDYGTAIDMISLCGGSGIKMYSGYYNISTDTTVIFTYTNDAATEGTVSMDSTYYVGDWVFSRLGNMRILYTTGLKDIPTGNTVVGYIPEGDRPAREFHHYIYSYNKQTTFMLHFTLNGAITINNETGQAINDDIWLNDNVVYNV